MNARFLLDTDVLIDFLRGQAEAVDFLEGQYGTLFVSAITVAELFGGVREGRERISLSTLIRAFEIIPVNAEIAERGGLFRRDFGKSHNTGLADALIAATAEHIEAQLVTLNRKHFPMLPELLVPYLK